MTPEDNVVYLPRRRVLPRLPAKPFARVFPIVGENPNFFQAITAHNRKKLISYRSGDAPGVEFRFAADYQLTGAIARMKEAVFVEGEPPHWAAELCFSMPYFIEVEAARHRACRSAWVVYQARARAIAWVPILS